jgi:hypothetical protein
MKDNLIGTINSGYTIIEQGKKAVLATDASKTLYVAWNYDTQDGKPSFFWGRYGNEDYARIAYNKKEAGEYSG